jgi:hypothetical protein
MGSELLKTFSFPFPFYKMTVRAETIETTAEFCRITGRAFKSYDVGPWVNDDKGRLAYANKIPQRRGIYAHGFLIDNKIALFYGGLTAAKLPNGLRTRIQHEYNKKSASLSKSGPYEACLFLEHYSIRGLPICILFHDMSDKTDDEIKQAEAELLKALDFCSNIKDNGCRRLDDLLDRVQVLVANAKPSMNIIEEKNEVVEEVAEEVEEERSDDYNRQFYLESLEFLSVKVLKEIHMEAMRLMHKFKADKVKEYLSDKIIAECAAKALC